MFGTFTHRKNCYDINACVTSATYYSQLSKRSNLQLVSWVAKTCTNMSKLVANTSHPVNNHYNSNPDTFWTNHVHTYISVSTSARFLIGTLVNKRVFFYCCFTSYTLSHKWRMIPLSILPFTNAVDRENASLQIIYFQLDLIWLIAREDFNILIWNLYYFLLLDFFIFCLIILLLPQIWFYVTCTSFLSISCFYYGVLCFIHLWEIYSW